MVVEVVRNHWLFSKEQLKWLLSRSGKKDLLIELENNAEKKGISYNELLNAVQEDKDLIVTVVDSCSAFKSRKVLYKETLTVTHKQNYIGTIENTIRKTGLDIIIQTKSDIHDYPITERIFQKYDRELEEEWELSEYYEEPKLPNTRASSVPLYSLKQIAHSFKGKGLTFLRVDEGYFYIMYNYLENLGIMYHTPQGMRVVLLSEEKFDDLHKQIVD